MKLSTVRQCDWEALVFFFPVSSCAHTGSGARLLADHQYPDKSGKLSPWSIWIIVVQHRLFRRKRLFFLL